MFSLDGEWIAYTSNKSGIDEVWIKRYPPDNNVEYKISEGGGSEPVWCHLEHGRPGHELYYRDGSNLIFATISITNNEVKVSSRDTLIEDKYVTSTYSSSYDIHPYLELLLFAKREEQPDDYNINVILHWFQQLLLK